MVDRIAPAGGYAVVVSEASLPGGTTSNAAVALARLGAETSFTGMIGDDADGALLRAALADAGVELAGLSVRPNEPTDASTIIIGGDPPDRTIYWHKGAHIVKGDRIDIGGVFDHDVVVLDVADAPLRRFLTDLPAHTAPRATSLGHWSTWWNPANRTSWRSPSAATRSPAKNGRRCCSPVIRTWTTPQPTSKRR